MQKAVEAKSIFAGEFLGRVMARALAVAEVNACMGRIVAAPTAGSCGILPATILTLKEEKNLSEEQAVMGLFTAAGIGMVIAKRASISGAEGGCQAECGSASAMAAAAMVELVGGTPGMAAQACAIAMKNTLGLVCDPVAGLVEVPCIKRNAGGAANAIVAAELALAGIESTIPVDEVIAAMKSIGDTMPSSLKETALGGLAATPTAKSITKTLYKL
jgi:L-serine dehydratase